MSSSTPVPDGPSLSPCSPWITADDVAEFAQLGAEPDVNLIAAVAQEAGDALFEISGRQFVGTCLRTVRPCSDPCGCYGWDAASGAGPYWWLGWWGDGAGGWGWRNECGDTFGCDPMAQVRLAGYPVREITQVKIDGQVVDPATYRLDEWRFLTRLDDPVGPSKRFWPGCQNMSLADTEQGTFSVTYYHGIDPPLIGKNAACQLAAQLYATASGKTSVLPAGTTKVQRQGIQIERGVLANWFEQGKPTGLIYLDTFLKAFWTGRAQRRPAVFSPDVQAFARRLG